MTRTCPAGVTDISIIGTRRQAVECVLVADKTSTLRLDPSRIVESADLTTPFPSGSIRDRQTQTFVFDRAGWTKATFHGTITGGTGRYEDATGTVTGTGTQRDGNATWRLTFHLG